MEVLRAVCVVTVPLAFLAPYKSYVIQWLIDAKSASEIPYLLALGGGIFLSVFLLEWVGRNLFSRINTSVARTKREELLGGILSRDLGAFKQDTAGSYVSQLTNDITAIQNEFLTPLYNIVLYGGMLVFALFFLYRIHPLMFLIAIAMAVFPAVIPHIFARRLKKSRSAFSKENAAYVTVSKDILQGFETLRGFGAEENAARQEFTRTIAIIPQSSFLFNGTVLENITLFSDKDRKRSSRRRAASGTGQPAGLASAWAAQHHSGKQPFRRTGTAHRHCPRASA